VSVIAVFLVAIGVVDLLRPLAIQISRPWLAVAAAPALVVVGAALCGLWHPGDLLLVGIAATAASGWELLSNISERWSGSRQAVPLLVFPGSLLAMFLLSGFASPVGGAVRAWCHWATPTHGISPARVVIVIGVVLMQTATGNQMVRLLLKSVGAVRPTGQPQPSDRLKGGRLLGPMERLLILGLGLAGQLSVATAVIAAKSIIRFPEINAQKAKKEGGIGIDELTEYFLIGSFASWIVALGGLALAATAAR
jgi:hypothetical protein